MELLLSFGLTRMLNHIRELIGIPDGLSELFLASDEVKHEMKILISVATVSKLCLHQSNLASKSLEESIRAKIEVKLLWGDVKNLLVAHALKVIVFQVVLDSLILSGVSHVSKCPFLKMR
jgi:hypothetical protein